MSDGIIELFVENGLAKASARIPEDSFQAVCSTDEGRALLAGMSRIATAPPPPPAPVALPDNVFVVCLANERGAGIASVLGVFFDFDAAVAQCSTPLHFVGPLRPNTVDLSADWPGVVFPRRKERPAGR